MEVTCLVAKLVLVQSLALMSGPTSLSAPALRPHTSAPAQSTFSKPAAAQVEIVDAGSADQRETVASTNKSKERSRNPYQGRRRVFADNAGRKGQEYWIVDYQ